MKEPKEVPPEPPRAANLLIGAAAKLADAATVLVLITAALYFWGYIYYSAFCERLGVSFHGIALPPEDYLIVSWLTVGMLLAVIAVGLILVYIVRDTVDILVSIMGKLGFKKPVSKASSPALPFLKLGLGVFVVAGVLLAGGKFMIIQGDEAADKALARPTSVTVRDGEGKVIEGRFIYLRDFGSALLVGELESEGKRIAAYRVLKASSYSGYSLTPPVTAPSGTKK